LLPLAFAAACGAMLLRARRHCCWAPALQQSPIDRYILLAGPTAANPPHAAAAVDSWDRQTDGRIPYSFAAYYAAVSTTSDWQSGIAVA